MRFRRKPHRKRAVGFYIEDEYYEQPPLIGVGALYSDYGALEAPRRWPWQKKEVEERKSAFGFARDLEEYYDPETGSYFYYEDTENGN